jgi:hypothetical protein
MGRLRGLGLILSATLVTAMPAAAVVDVTLYVWGADWLPPANCNNKIHLKLRDSGGESFSLGRFKPVNPKIAYEGEEYPAALEASPTIPDGARPGAAKIRGTQDWSFKFPGLGCFELFQISSARRSVTILGESGNDPPRITGFNIPDLPQGGPGSINWTASEPCAATVEIEYRLAPGMKYDLPAALAGHASVAGANTVPYDATSEGRALPAGEYRASMQCQEGNGAKSSISKDTFLVGFGR